jgi:hypothetical protein
MSARRSIRRVIGAHLVAAFVVAAASARANSYVVTTTASAGAGSLRKAIADANANPGPDVIQFNIAGAAPFVIAPVSPLPALVDAVTIDATTQPGWAGDPVVEINGKSIATTAGLVNPGRRLHHRRARDPFVQERLRRARAAVARRRVELLDRPRLGGGDTAVRDRDPGRGGRRERPRQSRLPATSATRSASRSARTGAAWRVAGSGPTRRA